MLTCSRCFHVFPEGTQHECPPKSAAKLVRGVLADLERKGHSHTITVGTSLADQYCSCVGSCQDQYPMRCGLKPDGTVKPERLIASLKGQLAALEIEVPLLEREIDAGYSGPGAQGIIHTMLRREQLLHMRGLYGVLADRIKYLEQEQ